MTDKAQSFRDSGTLVILKRSDTTLLRTSSTGMRGTLGVVKRKHQVIEFICRQTMTAEQVAAGVTLDQVSDWLRADIEWGVVAGDAALATASAALNAADPTWGHRPSYINPIVTKVLAGPILKWPHTIQVVRMEYLFDEQLPGGAAGTPAS